MSAEEARRYGIIDKVVEPDVKLLQAASAIEKSA